MYNYWEIGYVELSDENTNSPQRVKLHNLQEKIPAIIVYTIY